MDGEVSKLIVQLARLPGCQSFSPESRLALNLASTSTRPPPVKKQVLNHDAAVDPGECIIFDVPRGRVGLAWNSE